MPSKTARRRRKRSSGAEPARSCGAARSRRVHRADRAARLFRSTAVCCCRCFGRTRQSRPRLSSRTDGRASTAARFARCRSIIDYGPKAEPKFNQLAGWLAARSIRHHILVWDGKKPVSRIQETARTVRYRLLEGWCRAHSCLHLLTGHHRDDQIETHLLRRDRRSGPDGLAGMSAIRETDGCRILRPLLEIPKARLLATLAAEGQPFITDPSNLNSAYARARLRGSAGFRPRPGVSSAPRVWL